MHTHTSTRTQHIVPRKAARTPAHMTKPSRQGVTPHVTLRLNTHELSDEEDDDGNPEEPEHALVVELPSHHDVARHVHQGKGCRLGREVCVCVNACMPYLSCAWVSVRVCMSVCVYVCTSVCMPCVFGLADQDVPGELEVIANESGCLRGVKR